MAWKSKDAKFWDTFHSDSSVGWGSSGRLDKASATKEYTGADCEIKAIALSDVKTTSLGHEAALITHKTTVYGTCGGRKSPRRSWVASAYVRDGNRWKAAFHAEAVVADPAAPVTPVGTKSGGQAGQIKPIDQDAHSDALPKDWMA